MITLQQDTIYMGTAAPASGGGGSGDAVWGSITGTLANQTDLATALAGKQATSNLVTSLSSSSTDAQYPSAKCVYDIVGDVESLLAQV